ncbi:MAG: penicillin-binding protein activator [Gammaproteobacteria bacterium]|nr:penicillin-binding protein activator [Gammaproteobacteria bacterium]
MCFSHTGAKQTARYLAIFLTIAIVTAGCAPGTTRAPVEDTPSTVRSLTQDESIDEMITGLDPAAAISVLDNAATTGNPEKAFALLVRAAEIAIGHEPNQAVDNRLQSLYQRYPGQAKSVQLAILNSRVLLARNKPGQAIETLDSLLQQAAPAEKLSIYSLKAEALHQAGFPIESVQLRIMLDEDYQKRDPAKQADNDSRLWSSLMQVQPELISGHITEIPDTFSGWLELAHIAHRYQFDSISLNSEINNWITRNPGHPANRQIIEHIKKKQIATSTHPEHIALILPLSGKLAPVGKAVRDGFMSAYLESGRIFGTRSVIDVYDSRGNAEQAAQAVQIANDRGTQFIIGPLDRDAVSAAIEANQPPTPVAVTNAGAKNPPPPALPVQQPRMLTLNRVPGSMLTDLSMDAPDMSVSDSSPVTYQFDLAPETEAIQVAERASMEGLNYTMVMVPENIWGNRIYEAFAMRHQELGGEIIDVLRFKKNTSDFSSGIQQALKLNHSKVRHKQLEVSLHEDLGFTPRRRQDIDMIFIAASPHEARQIKPQLKFFYADDIPVYATSSIYSGDANPARDKDLENIKFCDMPWVLTDKPAPGSLHRTILSAWPQESKKYLRFYALGADAFMLLPQLEWLTENRGDWMAGGTGRLSLDKSGVVQRQLTWASFRQATPKREQIFSN